MCSDGMYDASMSCPMRTNRLLIIERQSMRSHSRIVELLVTPVGSASNEDEGMSVVQSTEYGYPR